MMVKKTICLAGTVLAISQVSFADVDWTASPVVINEGTAETPEVISENASCTVKTYIGKDGEGHVVVDQGAAVAVNWGSATSVTTVIGDGKDSAGSLRIADGSWVSGYSLYVGNTGEGSLTIEKGTVSSSRFCYVGNGASGVGRVKVSGPEAVLSIPRQVIYGNNGHAEVEVANGGVVRGRETTLGETATGSAILRIYAGSMLTVSENYPLTIGNAGMGIIYLYGGTLARSSSSMKLVVRAQESGYGLLSGWGTVDISAAKSSKIVNNGLIIANGRAEDGTIADRTLSLNRQDNPFENTIENTTTNGWYAINGGLLSVEHATFNIPVGEAGVYTWGEAASDDEIDLVNSARVTFKNITSAISSFTGKLYAPDRSDVPAGLPSGKTVAGIWKFDINGKYESADVEFRYDHVLAPKGVALYQHDGTAWVKLTSTALPNHRVKVERVDPTKMFAAVAEKSGMIVIVQ